MVQRWLILLAGALLLTALPQPAAAQRRDTANARAELQRRGLTQADVIERLRASGMTRDQVRAELQRRGYDPGLADPYFDAMGREPGAAGGRRQDEFLRALEEMGLAGEDEESARSLRPRNARDTLQGRLDPDALELLSEDTLDYEAWLEPDTTDLATLLGLPEEERLRPGELPIFGRSFFRRAGGRVDVPAYGPVDASYRLGPGDEVSVVLTGAVQDAYMLRVSRDGTLVVPEVGQVVANGLTLGGLEDLLRARFANVYSGVGMGEGALTRVSVSLGRVRMIQVYVIGDVERPGAYQVSSISTVLSALYQAGGPARTGSFREIEVRQGSELRRRFDLYDYLLHGNSSVDERLQHGDVVFVPPVTRRVELAGAVKRPGVYEMLPQDSLRDAIRFAGGPEAEAALRSVQIDRILPPAQRTEGTDRVLVDVDVVRLFAERDADVALADGDEVRIFSVPAERRNVVTIVGEVRRPGAYAWAPGTTLRDVVERASGVTDNAYTGRAHVHRLDPTSGARQLVQAPLAADAAAGVALADRDSVVVFSRDRLRTREYVTIGGKVKRPGRYPLAEGATVNDLILAAGGFAEGAYQTEAYVARPNLSDVRADTTARAFRVPLLTAGTGDAAPDGMPVSSRAPAWTSGEGEGEFVLRHGDRVEIRQAPGYEQARTVLVTGEVALPGAYVLETRGDRLTQLLGVAGGLTDVAYAPGVQVVRRGDVVPMELTRALERPGSAADLVLQPGDSIHVPSYEPTVLVTGAVAYRTRVPYRADLNLGDYIREAGGFTRAADRTKTSVTYQNGQRSSVRALPLLPDRQPRPGPGSTIFVPERPADARDGINWGTLFSQLIAAAGATATLLIALDNINK